MRSPCAVELKDVQQVQQTLDEADGGDERDDAQQDAVTEAEDDAFDVDAEGGCGDGEGQEDADDDGDTGDDLEHEVIPFPGTILNA